jgi:hypothetical protein
MAKILTWRPDTWSVSVAEQRGRQIGSMIRSRVIGRGILFMKPTSGVAHFFLCWERGILAMERYFPGYSYTSEQNLQKAVMRAYARHINRVLFRGASILFDVDLGD